MLDNAGNEISTGRSRRTTGLEELLLLIIPIFFGAAMRISDKLLETLRILFTRSSIYSEMQKVERNAFDASVNDFTNREVSQEVLCDQ